MNIAEILSTHATTRPGAAAIVDTHGGRPRTTTFADLERSSARTAALFEREGLRPGDRVLVFHPMSAELYAILIALFRLGLVAMFLDPSAGRDHIERCCRIAAPKALVAGARAHLLRIVSPALRRIPLAFSVGFPVPFATSLSRARTLDPRERIEDCADDTPALLTFTSGSTGRPKAAVRTHGFLLAQHRVLERSLSLTPGDVDLTTLPIFVLANLGSGVTSLIPNADLRFPGRIDPGPVVEQIRRERAASTAASPALLERIAGHCERERIALDAMKKIFTGGAPVFPALLDRLIRVAPGAEVVAVYGSTEAEPIADLPASRIRPEDATAMASGKGLLAGHPVEEIDLRVVRDRWGTPVGPYTAGAFEAERLGPDEAGEIVVSGAHVLAGYLDGEGDEETKFRVDGRVWHRTGDAGYLDAGGRIWLLGRCSARIEDAKGTLFPFAVECAVSGRREVRRSAVALHRGRRVLAVELDDAAGSPDVGVLERELAWARLDLVRVVGRIPVDKRHNAKVDYTALAAVLDRM